MERKKLFLIFSVFLIIFSIFLASLSILIAYSISIQRNSLLTEEDIYYERFSVKMRDGIEIKGLLYVDNDLEEKEDNSVPTILLLQGINGRKEHKLNIIFQLVKRGFAVFTVEQRGHGESGGFTSFLNREPKDMEQVIDHIEENYDFANSTHIGLLGFSYGGGVGAILQAKDDRIYASVLYHPLVSIKHLTELMPFQNLIGIGYGLGRLEDIDDGLEVCKASNTKNLLLLHGEKDELISKHDSEKLYEQVGGEYRTDIGLEIRDNLNHFENEEDDESLKYAIIWFEHFYYDCSIDTNNRDYAISFVKLEDFKYPNSLIPEVLMIVAGIILLLGMSILIVPLKIWPLSNQKSLSLRDEFLNVELEGKEYKKALLANSIVYILPVVIVAPLISLFNPSYIFGYGLIIPIITIILFLLLPRFEKNDWKSKWKSDLKKKMMSCYRDDSKILLYGSLLIILSILFFISIFNYNAYIMTSLPIPFFNSTMFLYFMMAISTFYMDYLLIRKLKIQHTIILIGLRSLSLIIFFIFVPIPAFAYTGLPIGGDIAQILILSLIGVAFWIIMLIMRFFKIFYKNIITVILIFLFPLIIYLLFLFLRIV